MTIFFYAKYNLSIKMILFTYLMFTSIGSLTNDHCSLTVSCLLSSLRIRKSSHQLSSPRGQSRKPSDYINIIIKNIRVRSAMRFDDTIDHDNILNRPAQKLQIAISNDTRKINPSSCIFFRLMTPISAE